MSFPILSQISLWNQKLWQAFITYVGVLAFYIPNQKFNPKFQVMHFATSTLKQGHELKKKKGGSVCDKANKSTKSKFILKLKNNSNILYNEAATFQIFQQFFQILGKKEKTRYTI